MDARITIIEYVGGHSQVLVSGADIIYSLIGRKDFDCVSLLRFVCNVKYIPFPDMNNCKFLTEWTITNKEPELNDILLYDFHGQGIDHVGLYIGNNEIFHYLDTTGVVISKYTNKYLERRFRGVLKHG